MSKPLQPSFSKRVPPGEDRARAVCDHCGFVDYVNPCIVAGAVVAWSEEGAPFGPVCVPLEQVKILLCRRAILPRRGYWTLPAGFMETGETTEAAAMRETMEEAGARIACDALLCVYDIPARSQVQLFRRARLLDTDFKAGPESLDAVLFAWADIPWTALAFHSVAWALQAFARTRALEAFAPDVTPAVLGWPAEIGAELGA